MNLHEWPSTQENGNDYLKFNLFFSLRNYIKTQPFYPIHSITYLNPQHVTESDDWNLKVQNLTQNLN